MRFALAGHDVETDVVAQRASQILEKVMTNAARRAVTEGIIQNPELDDSTGKVTVDVTNQNAFRDIALEERANLSADDAQAVENAETFLGPDRMGEIQQGIWGRVLRNLHDENV